MVNATVYNAIQAGIVNDGAKVKIDSSSVYQIGDTPSFTGAQHGYAIYVYGFNAAASGDVTNNVVWNFQKNGIVVRGPASSNVSNNTVTGLGPTTIIAQNGIEIGLGASVSVKSNTIFGMSYTGVEGPGAAAGILLFGGHCYDGFITPSAAVQANTSVSSNNVAGSDVGIWLNNLAADCVSSDSRSTKNSVTSNAARNNSVFNVSGGPLTSTSLGYPYQAGISDQGRSDTILGNSICGIGYTPQNVPNVYIFTVDTTLAISPLSLLNFCF